MKEIMDMTIDNNRIVAEWKESKYIVFSSSFFMAPAIYGFYNNLYLLPVVLVLTTFFSMNYWRRATYSWRRIADRTFAKIAFAFFFINGVTHVTYRPYLITGHTATTILLYCYYMSNKYHHLPVWWKYHMVFHLMLTYNQFLVINSIVYGGKLL
jgi:hypothetical protein